MFLVICLLCCLFTFQYVETKLSKGEKLIYEFHRKVREAVENCQIPGQPPAKKLENLKWNKLLAEKAKQQAKRCKYDSNDPNDFIIGDFESVGQNLADYPTIEGAMKDWFEEHKSYNFDKNECSGDCKNYKQMVWNTTKSIGCGYSKCEKNYLIVCNYSPSDSEERPYETKPESECKTPE
ncbi:unnamed protein product [Schistosoma turkestanicum]|nr:unnamed protein product [Schistosoma turkestanicum]